MNDRALPKGDRDEPLPPKKKGEGHFSYVKRLAETPGVVDDQEPEKREGGAE